MHRLKKHAVTLIIIAIVIAVALLIWSRKAVAAEPATCTTAGYVCS